MALKVNDVFRGHLVIIALLAAGHTVFVILLGETPPFSAERIRTFFDLDMEAAPGAYFSALAWLAVAGAALLHVREDRLFWYLVAALAAVMSLDEAVRIHERFTAIGERITPASGVFTISWWAIYPLVLAPALVVGARGFFRLDTATRNRLLIAGALFVVGAVGLEIAESLATDAFIVENGLRGPQGTNWSEFDFALDTRGADLKRLMDRLVVVEEGLEMIGVALALRALLLRAADKGAEVRVAIERGLPTLPALAHRRRPAPRSRPRR
jgi:hypothetical protein